MKIEKENDFSMDSLFNATDNWFDGNYFLEFFYKHAQLTSFCPFGKPELIFCIDIS